ncbi:MAG: DUF502 domain-containing protein [Chlamydiales bacterium]
MKKYFLTGLVILLPLAVTIAIVVFIINLLTLPFLDIIKQFLEAEPWYPKYRALIHVLLQIVVLFALFFFTVLLGFLARAVVFKSLLSLYEYILHRIPIIKTVYKATQQVIKAIFGSTSRTFKQVVMVPFPTDGAYCIGLVSGPAPELCEKTITQPLVSVFVPTTPNPTSGYLMMYQKEKVIYLDMKIEDAFKYIISCGVIAAREEGIVGEIAP